MKSRIGDELLFPVYDQTVEQGANFDYEVIGWVGFVVTDFIKVQGNNKRITGSVRSSDLGRTSVDVRHHDQLRRASNSARRIVNEKVKEKRRS